MRFQGEHQWCSIHNLFSAGRILNVDDCYVSGPKSPFVSGTDGDWNRKRERRVTRVSVKQYITRKYLCPSLGLLHRGGGLRPPPIPLSNNKCRNLLCVDHQSPPHAWVHSQGLPRCCVLLSDQHSAHLWVRRSLSYGCFQGGRVEDPGEEHWSRHSDGWRVAHDDSNFRAYTSCGVVLSTSLRLDSSRLE